MSDQRQAVQKANSEVHAQGCLMKFPGSESLDVVDEWRFGHRHLPCTVQHRPFHLVTVTR